MKRYGLYTKFKTQTGKTQELIGILSEAARSVSGVKGNVLYIVNKDIQHENCIWVTEIWETKDAHESSLKIEGAMELISKALPLLEGNPEQIKLEVITY